jgi:hypothetical protein
MILIVSPSLRNRKLSAEKRKKKKKKKKGHERTVEFLRETPTDFVRECAV